MSNYKVYLKVTAHTPKNPCIFNPVRAIRINCLNSKGWINVNLMAFLAVWINCLDCSTLTESF